MKVLVTGGGGYIGCLVVELLLQQKYEVVVLDTFFWGKEALEPFMDQITVHEGDCRNSKDILDALEGVNSVIHLAGIVGDPACKINDKAHHTTNIECTRTLVQLCTDPDLPLRPDFIFVSSCSVYGNVKGLYEEVNETTPPSPLSFYADAKLKSEQIIMKRAAEIPNFHPTILRLTTVFGWSNRPRIDLVTNLFSYKAWKEKKLTIFGDGLQYRSLIHVQDIADAVVHVLGTPRFMRSKKIFHVGEETNNKTVKEIAEIVQRNMPGTELLMEPGQPSDRRDYRISCQRIKNITGWHAKYSVEDGIKEMIKKFETEEFDWDSFKYRNNRFEYK